MVQQNLDGIDDFVLHSAGDAADRINRKERLKAGAERPFRYHTSEDEGEIWSFVFSWVSYNDKEQDHAD